jgi:hypothetical protein
MACRRAKAEEEAPRIRNKGLQTLLCDAQSMNVLNPIEIP